MGEREFIDAMERMFERSPMRRKKVNAIIYYRIMEIQFYRSIDHPSSMMSLPEGVIVRLNTLQPASEIEVSFAHEISHEYYEMGIRQVFRKHMDGFPRNWSGVNEKCEEDLLDWAAYRFCRENPGYLSDVLADIVACRAYPHIRTSYTSDLV